MAPALAKSAGVCAESTGSSARTDAHDDNEEHRTKKYRQQHKIGHATAPGYQKYAVGLEKERPAVACY
jgi:hypothetical protein